jgi:L-fuconolactonase
MASRGRRPHSPPNRAERNRVIVDAHVHLWDAPHTPQPWMTAEHDPIARPFGPSDLEPLLERNGVDAVVLVQGACLDSDTAYLLAEAERHDWIAGVTAWLPLDDPDRTKTRLEELETYSSFRAVRHLIHNEADPHWILQPPVQESLALLEERNVILELPVVFPRHLGDVPVLAERFPTLTIVVDHLGKPPIGTDEMQAWARELGAAAARPGVLAKISGLNTALDRTDWEVDDLLPACGTALECFGPGRLMCGSDWPVALLNGDYDRVWHATRRVVETVAGRDADALLGENAARVYRFSDAPATRVSPEGKDAWHHR